MHADPCGVPDGVGDRRTHTDGPEFADTLSTERAGMRVDFVNEVDFKLGNIGVHWHQVAGQVLRQIAAKGVVHG